MRTRNNPIPQLIKGRHTPYQSKTRKGRSVLSEERQAKFCRDLVWRQRGFGWESKTFCRPYYAISGGLYWVGVVSFLHVRYPDWYHGASLDQYNIVATIQSGSTWAAAENKVKQYMADDGEDDVPTTGSGAIGFLRFVSDTIEETTPHFKAEARNNNYVYLDVQPTGPKKASAYRKLRDLGFTPVDDLGDTIFRRIFVPPSS